MQFPIPSLLKPALTKSVAIFGMGVSGFAVQQLLTAVGAESLLYDEASDTVFGEADCAEHALVVFSPGFAVDHPWLQLARARGLLCLGELDFSALFWREQLQAIPTRPRKHR